MQPAEPTSSFAPHPQAMAAGRGELRAGRDRRAASPTKAYGNLERSFAACGLIAAVGTVGGAELAVRGYGAAPVLAVTSAALLLCVCLGNLALERVIQFQRGELARVYVNAVEAPRRAVFERRGAGPTRMETMRMALADLVASTRMAVFGGDRARLWAVAMRRALDDRAEISRTLAAALGEDAHAIAAAATSARRAEAEIGADVGMLVAHAGRAADATASMEDEAGALQDNVRQTTAQLRQASALAGSLADNALNAQHGVAAVGEVTLRLLRAADDVKAVLGQGTGGSAALEALMQAAQALIEDAATIGRTIGVIGEGVQAHGALGQALSEAVSRQMEDVARLVAKAGEAKSEVLALRHHAAGLERRDLGLGSGPAARRAVERLPAHAEAIAQILRDLPSFDPAKT